MSDTSRAARDSLVPVPEILKAAGIPFLRCRYTYLANPHCRCRRSAMVIIAALLVRFSEYFMKAINTDGLHACC